MKNIGILGLAMIVIVIALDLRVAHWIIFLIGMGIGIGKWKFGSLENIVN